MSIGTPQCVCGTPLTRKQIKNWRYSHGKKQSAPPMFCSRKCQNTHVKAEIDKKLGKELRTTGFLTEIIERDGKRIPCLCSCGQHLTQKQVILHLRRYKGARSGVAMVCSRRCRERINTAKSKKEDKRSMERGLI